MTIIALIAVVVGGASLVNWARNSVSRDPVVIEAAAREMIDSPPPLGMDPKFTANLLIAKIVVYASADGASQMTLAQFDKSIVGGDKAKQAEFERNLNSGLEGGHGRGQQEFEISKSETRKLKIRGAETKVTFTEAKVIKSGVEYELIRTSFRGKLGPAQIELQIPKEQYQEDEVVKFLEGIK